MKNNNFGTEDMDSLVNGLITPEKPEDAQQEQETESAPEAASSPEKSRRGRKPRGPEYEVVSMVVDKNLMNVIRAIAHNEGLAYKEVVGAFLKHGKEEYEAKHGVVRPFKPKKKGDLNGLL